MKIVLFTSSALPTIGGKEVVVHYLAKTFHQLGHQVRVTGPAGWWGRRNLKFEYPVHRWPTLRGFFPEQVTMARIALDTVLFGADVIHAHSTYPPGFLACRLKRYKNIPVVITPHGEDIHLVPEIGFGQRANPKIEPKIRQAVQQADVLTAISKSVADSLIDAGADPKKIVMIPNGTDAQRFAATVDMDVRAWLQIEADAKIILTVGNYHLRKGYQVLFESMHHVLKEEPKARLVIVGRDEAQQLAELKAQHRLNGKVMLTGAIPLPRQILGTQPKDGSNGFEQDVLAGLHQAADVYVSAGVTDGSEGLSLAVLDALTAGLPIVATNISGNKDIIENGKSGLLVEPGSAEQMAQAMVYLLKNRAIAHEYGKNAFAVSRQYHWRSVADQYLALYRKLVGP